MSDLPLALPPRIALARLPTPVEHLERVSAATGRGIFVKRDDLTGCALSGNKVRKLEFLLAEAREKGAERVLTCGGVQSNHARATAVAARRLGMDSHLFLRGKPPAAPEGNVLLDRLVGAEITYVTPREYREAVPLMEAAAAESGVPCCVIPEGGSNALGSLGYALSVVEILSAEGGLGAPFDAVVHATGSGGTQAGLILGRRAFGLKAEVYGVNVCDDEAYFVEKVGAILGEACGRYAPDLSLGPEDVRVLDGYVGPGYARNVPEDRETIRETARSEGIFLDPAYTVKAFRGMLAELDGGRLADCRRVLFIHTGGIFSLFPRAEELLPD